MCLRNLDRGAIPYYWLLISVNNQKQQFETPRHEKKNGDKVSKENRHQRKRWSQPSEEIAEWAAAAVWAPSLRRENRKQVRRWAGKVLGNNGRGRGYSEMPSEGTGKWKPLEKKSKTNKSSKIFSWRLSWKCLSSHRKRFKLSSTTNDLCWLIVTVEILWQPSGQMCLPPHRSSNIATLFSFRPGQSHKVLIPPPGILSHSCVTLCGCYNTMFAATFCFFTEFYQLTPHNRRPLKHPQRKIGDVNRKLRWSGMFFSEEDLFSYLERKERTKSFGKKQHRYQHWSWSTCCPPCFTSG